MKSNIIQFSIFVTKVTLKQRRKDVLYFYFTPEGGLMVAASRLCCICRLHVATDNGGLCAATAIVSVVCSSQQWFICLSVRKWAKMVLLASCKAQISWLTDHWRRRRAGGLNTDPNQYNEWTNTFFHLNGSKLVFLRGWLWFLKVRY